MEETNIFKAKQTPLYFILFTSKAFQNQLHHHPFPMKLWWIFLVFTLL
jgi:hypothetical protein